MARTRRLTSQRRRTRRQIIRDRYIRIVAVSLVIIAVASFYVYQRVWVRQLVSEIERLEARNAAASRYTATLEAQWKTSSSIGALERRITELNLGLRPTLPDQNFVLTPPQTSEDRFAGFVNALEKLTRHLPVISTNEAGAEELFDTE